MGDAYKTTAGGGISNLYGIAWSHPNAGGIAANLNTHGALITENGTFLAALSGSIRCRDDMRSPIFYDSNNTAYYTDPASTSYLNALNTAGTTILADTKINFVGSAGGHSFGASHYSMGKDTANGGWSHPHYSDLIIGYHTGIRLGANYSGIRFYNNSPTTDANNDGNGDSGEALLMTVGGYVGTANHTDVVVNNNLFANASMRSPIFYDSNNTAYYTDPASTSRMNRIDYTNLYLASNTAYGFIGANVYADTINSGSAGDQLELCYYSGTFTSSSGSMRAPIFYDRDNTGYYLDPASTSNLNSVSMQGGNVYGAMYFSSNSGATSGALSNPPLQVYSSSNNSAFMSFHKGGYYAVNFGLDSDNVLRIGGWSASANRWQLDMAGNVTVAGTEAIKEQQIQINNLKDMIINNKESI
jgi:hypothetical protein